MMLNPGKRLESFPEGHPPSHLRCPPTAWFYQHDSAAWPGTLVTTLAEARAGASQAPGLWQRMPARPPASPALEPAPGIEQSSGKREVAPAGKQTERLLDFLTGPAACQGPPGQLRAPSLTCETVLSSFG